MRVIGRFVHEVAGFKAAAASGKPIVRSGRTRSVFKPEFEGLRRGYTPAGEIEARCDHGTVVRQLYELLAKDGHEAVNDQRDLDIVAGDRLTHLFEVKTDISTTSLYQAVGQLMLHGAAQSPFPRRILVVPSQPKASTLQALNGLRITVLVYEWVEGQVTFPYLAKAMEFPWCRVKNRRSE